jgi:hypothetical protein
MTNSYRLLGAALLAVGLCFSAIFGLFVFSVPLSAIGLSAIIMGFTTIFLANSGIFVPAKGVVSGKFNKIILSLAITFTLINLLLALFNQNDFTVYYVLNALAYLILAWLFIIGDPKTKSAFNAMSLIIFAGFLVILAYKITTMLK